MPRAFASLPDLLDHGFDTVIDVRSPAEFAADHIPGAINLPVLSNAERAEVGTIYTQESPFRARKIGAAMVFRNASAHIAGPLAEKSGDWRPLVYCWRGGQRSGSFGWMLREIGWRAEIVEGGYRSYRRLVHGLLYDGVLPHRIVLIDGFTGTAKTELLGVLAERGQQVIDLEGLANHRGSLLGALPGGQPPQRAFESRLAAEVVALDPARPVFLEAESNKIGALFLPPALWAAMKAAPRIEVTAEIGLRTAYLTAAYDDILSDRAGMREKLAPLVRLRGHEVVEGWLNRLDTGDKAGLTRALMEQHYDPAYTKARGANPAERIGRIRAAGLDRPGLEEMAAKVERLVVAAAQIADG